MEFCFLASDYTTVTLGVAQCDKTEVCTGDAEIVILQSLNFDYVCVVHLTDVKEHLFADTGLLQIQMDEEQGRVRLRLISHPEQLLQ